METFISHSTHVIKENVGSLTFILTLFKETGQLAMSVSLF